MVGPLLQEGVEDQVSVGEVEPEVVTPEANWRIKGRGCSQEKTS